MKQSDNTCLAGTGFAFMIAAFALVLTSLLTPSWMVYYSSNSFSFTGYWLLGSCVGGTCSGFDKATDYQIACFALVITAIVLSGLGFICLFLYLCGSCCCPGSQWMTVMPQINLPCGILGGILTTVTCVVYLIGFYVIDDHSGLTGYEWTYDTSGNYLFASYRYVNRGWIPGYSFYLAGVSGLFMFISAGVAFSAKNATRVGVAPGNTQTIVVSSSLNQASSYQPQQYNPYQPQPYNPYQPQPYYPYQNQPYNPHKSQPKPETDPTYHLPGSTTPYGSHPEKDCTVNPTTKTSQADLREASDESKQSDN